MRRALTLLVTLALPLLTAGLACADPLDDLARDVWAWRAATQPSSGDDIPRLERPAGWRPDWSREAMAARRTALADFTRRHQALDPASWPATRQVDYRLIGSALARVRWELDGAPAWRRDPAFYIQQALGPVFEVLLPPPPVGAARADQVVTRLGQVATIVAQAKANLDDPRAPFARLAIDTLSDIEARLATLASELDIAVPDHGGRFAAPATAAAAALVDLRGWLEGKAASMATDTAVGRDAYVTFLREVALVPFSPEEIVTMGRQEWERAVAFEALEQGRNRALPEMPIFPNALTQVTASAFQEQAIRLFLEREGLLTVPPWVKHYRNRLLPLYLAPLSFLGVTDDLTGPSRLAEDGYAYIREPRRDLPYFYLSTARDPRPIIVHEGVPGHYLQLVLSWAHENPIRRHYYDSGANEGLGFYAEEMMLQAGLWHESPRSREIIYNFARLRALRVEVDVKLATGVFTIPQAAEYLEKTVPMDIATALEEAASFAAGPGQAITYQIGKLQVTSLLADRRRAQGGAFSLRAFHDYVWKNGNVPFSLLRWELLGDRRDIDRLRTLR
ncbi:MAG: DUF885 family protein [Acidobacteria bacterium]|nr:DUF885 family protein [Acidobacteriota bacterium]